MIAGLRGWCCAGVSLLREAGRSRVVQAPIVYGPVPDDVPNRSVVQSVRLLFSAFTLDWSLLTG